MRLWSYLPFAAIIILASPLALGQQASLPAATSPTPVPSKSSDTPPRVGQQASSPDASASTPVPSKTSDTPPREDLNKILMYRYEVMAGGWYMDRRCHILSADDASLFEKYIGELNVYAQHSGLAPTNVLLQMQANGRLGSTQEKYKDCGKDAANVVKATFMLAGMLYKDLIVSK
jgi:hypothetical protein